MSIVLQCWGLEPLPKRPAIKYNASLHISSNLSHYNEVCILIYIVAVLVGSKWGVSRRGGVTVLTSACKLIVFWGYNRNGGREGG